jgi:hypothetical protein
MRPGFLIWTRTYDPARNPAHWTKLIRPGQYAVFMLDAATHVARDAEGGLFNPDEGVSIAPCSDLPEAVSFATDVVTRHPNLCGEIYDHEGKAKDALQVVYNQSVRGKYVGLQYAKRQAAWGSLALVCGMVFIAHDFMRDLTWIWGYIIGLKLTLVGGFRLLQGLLGWYEHRGDS